MLYMKLTSVILILIVALMGSPTIFFQPQSVEDLIVYDDQLATNWFNWSWDSSVNLYASAVVYSGTRSIQVTYNGWGGLSFYKVDIPLYGKTHLQFYVHGGEMDKLLRFFVNFDDGSESAGYSFTAKAGQWQKIEISLNALNPDNRKITRLNWRNASGNGGLTVYFDEIKFVGDVAANAPQILSGEYRSHAIRAGRGILAVRAEVNHPQGRDTIARVSLESDTGDWQAVPLFDDGLNNDGEAGDGLFGAALTLPAHYAGREIELYLRAMDRDGNSATRYLGVLTVLSDVNSPIPAGLPQKLGWGSNAWSKNPSDDWQKKTGVPWNYVYQYITWGWEEWGDNFVQSFVDHSWNNGFVPVVTIYMILGPTGGN